jgi:hypothetical protein
MDGLIECDFLATNFPSSDSVPVWLTLFIFSANYGLRAVSLIVPPPCLLWSRNAQVAFPRALQMA